APKALAVGGLAAAGVALSRQEARRFCVDRQHVQRGGGDKRRNARDWRVSPPGRTQWCQSATLSDVERWPALLEGRGSRARSRRPEQADYVCDIGCGLASAGRQTL